MISIVLPVHHLSEQFATRDNHEVLLRKIHTYLIKNNIIKNNIIDSGAWIGDNSIPWAKNISGIVYAIDPSNSNCIFIKEIASLNNIHNINVLQYALSDTDAVLYTNDNINHCSFVYNTSVDSATSVIPTTLDTLYHNNIITNVDFIHLDTEGMEYVVLKGSYKLITSYYPIITFEQHIELDDCNKLYMYLHAFNYSIYRINEVLPGCRPDCTNFIAFPSRIDHSTLVSNIIEILGKDVLIKIST
jgi:FkbM family methyltransferase